MVWPWAEERRKRKPAPKKKPYSSILECLLCRERFARKDLEDGTYRLETMVCSFCYARMQSAPYAQSCFGKATVKILTEEDLERTVEYGYNPVAEECSFHCPDSVVCRLVIFKR